jgi:hypothetical protein
LWNTFSPDNDTPAQFPTEIETNTSCSRGTLPARTLLLKSTTTSLMWMSTTTLLPLPTKRSYYYYSSFVGSLSVQPVPVELPSVQLAFCASSCEAEDAETL